MSQSVFNRVSHRALGDISSLVALTSDAIPANTNNKLDLAACSLRGLLQRPNGEMLEQVAEAA